MDRMMPAGSDSRLALPQDFDDSVQIWPPLSSYPQAADPLMFLDVLLAALADASIILDRFSNDLLSDRRPSRAALLALTKGDR